MVCVQDVIEECVASEMPVFVPMAPEKKCQISLWGNKADPPGQHIRLRSVVHRCPSLPAARPLGSSPAFSIASASRLFATISANSCVVRHSVVVERGPQTPREGRRPSCRLDQDFQGRPHAHRRWKVDRGSMKHEETVSHFSHRRARSLPITQQQVHQRKIPILL